MASIGLHPIVSPKPGEKSMSTNSVDADPLGGPVNPAEAPANREFGGTSRGWVRLRTLVLIRWVAVFGQLMAILLVHFGLGFSLPLIPALAAVAASAMLNVVVSLRYATATRLRSREATLYLGYDIVQLATLLFLSGGLTNPFSVLFLVPVTISATVLSRQATVLLGTVALACISALAMFYMPLPWSGPAPEFPRLYIDGIWIALVSGMAFMTIYAWRIAEEARRMADALAATQIVLAREQKLSALGGLAAAAAHELGTPLGTIALVAKEVAVQLPEGSEMAEDMALISSQTNRCREILGQLSSSPEAEGRGQEFSHVSLKALTREAVQLHGGDLEIELVDIGEGSPPQVPRHPEILHGLGSFIENATDFAAGRVEVTSRWSEAGYQIEIVDDGPGFSNHILKALGEPYVTSRRLSDSGGGGLGLGVFIATTLLERTGADVDFRNQSGGGAKVVVSWRRL